MDGWLDGWLGGWSFEFEEFEWGCYALSASKAIFRARTYNCITYSDGWLDGWLFGWLFGWLVGRMDG